MTAPRRVSVDPLPAAPAPIPGAPAELLLKHLAELNKRHGDTSDPYAALPERTA